MRKIIAGELHPETGLQGSVVETRGSEVEITVSTKAVKITKETGEGASWHQLGGEVKVIRLLTLLWGSGASLAKIGGRRAVEGNRYLYRKQRRGV